MSKIACVFPGQGSQSLGMLKDLAENFPSVNVCFEESSDALGYDLWKICQQGPESSLNQTEITQPALLTASIACLQVLQSEQGIQADYYAGHSLGEYSALVAAKVIDLSQGVKIVSARGKFMQAAVKPGDGAMYAIIGLDDEAIATICEQVANETKQVVAPVNFNSPGQVVIAGQKEAVVQAAAAIKEAGAKRALPLAVSVPSHCALMKGASEELSHLLDELPFASPVVPVVNNVDVAVANDSKAIKDALVRQLYMPVQWTKSINYLAQQGVSDIIEVGPGKVLTGLIKRIDKSIATRSFNSPSDL
ncbi:ACP S-malonyltransferase [Glaciecola sp. 2405UD65-10]|uniref:ACP S-malonyltransferase n=1 Tax=Glaciecola sp. 2405UD65-10 TaxID=3397244 RepID=UPI003B5C8E9B